MKDDGAEATEEGDDKKALKSEQVDTAEPAEPEIKKEEAAKD